MSRAACKPPKKFGRARKGLGTSLALQCYAGFARGSFYGRSHTMWQQETWVNYSFFSFFVYSLRKIVCSLWVSVQLASQSQIKGFAVFWVSYKHDGCFRQTSNSSSCDISLVNFFRCCSCLSRYFWITISKPYAFLRRVRLKWLSE